MKILTIVAAFLAAGCGEGHPDSLIDLAMSPSSVDLAELVDQASVIDMARPPACSMPKPGAYRDTLQYNYASLSSPNMVTSAQAVTTTLVYNDGTIKRPSPAIPTPFDLHCDFTEKSIDAESCMAPCCVGQPGTPTFYFDAAGWVLVTNGVCQFQTTSAISYSATIVDGNGFLYK